MIRSIAVLMGFAMLGVPAAAAEVSIGDTVLAYWEKDDAGAYFVGTAVEKKGDGFFVVFEDGDTAIVDKTKVRGNDIKAGSKVVARWQDGNYYGGTVTKIVGRALYIHYDDGDKGWVPWSWIAVR